MESADPRMIVKRITVPEDDAEWFEATYPAYGSWTWLIQTFLAKFRAAHETTPEELIDIGLREMEREAYEYDTSGGPETGT